MPLTLVEDGRATVVDAEPDDLVAQAARLGRPLALDADEGVAWLGVSADARTRALQSLDAPDFSLPDLDGRMHSLSAYRGRKVLLVVWASW